MTIYDIAREAGVSASTVSRVVNGKAGVNPKTREKIQKLLAENHYVPNEAARGLVTSSSRMVGILVADVRTQHHIEGAYYIAKELSGLDYTCLILNAGNSDEERAKGIRALEQRKVEAAVLMGSIFQTEKIRDEITQHLADVPVFMLNGFIDLPNVYSVLADERSGLKDCVKLLARSGKNRIVFFVDIPTPSSKLKIEGFTEGMRELGKHPRDIWVYSDVEGSLQGGYETMQRAMREHPDLDGVICSLDILSCGALRALQDAGVQVPQQVGVIGVDNSVYAEITNPKLTSLDNMIFDSGVTIAHKLTDCLEGRKTNRRTLLFTSVVERESTENAKKCD